MATEAAHIRIKVDADGAAKTKAELAAVDQAIDNIDGKRVHVNVDVDKDSLLLVSKVLGGALLGPSVGAGLAGVVTMLGPLISGLTAVAGGGIAAGVGLAAVGGSMALMSTQALEAALGTENLAESLEKLGKIKPIQKGWEDIEKIFKRMGPEVLGAIKKWTPLFLKQLKQAMLAIEPFFKEITNTFASEGQEWGRMFLKLMGDILPYASEWIKRFSDILQALFKAMSSVAVPATDALLTALEGLGRGLRALVEAGAPLIKVLGETFGRFFQQLGENLGNIARNLAPTFGIFMNLLADVFNEIGRLLTVLSKGIGPAANGLAEGLLAIGRGLTPIMEAFAGAGPAIGRFLAALGKLIGALGPGLGGVIDMLGPVFDAFGRVFEKLAPVIERIATAFADLLVPMAPIIDLLGTALVWALELAIPALELLGSVVKGIGDVISVFWNSIRPLIESWLPDIGKASKKAGNEFKLIGKAVRWVGFLILWFLDQLGILEVNVKGLPKKTRKAWREFNATIKQTLADAARNLMNWVREKLRAFGIAVAEFFENLLTGAWVGQFISGLGNIGKEAIQSLVSGFMGGLTQFGNGLPGIIAANITNPIQSGLKINSPSLVMRDIGRGVSEGLSMGMNEGLGAVHMASQRLVTAIGTGMGAPAVAIAGGGSVSGGMRSTVTGNLRITNWDEGTAHLTAAADRKERRKRMKR